MPSSSPVDVVYLHVRDNIAVAARPLDSGSQITAGEHSVCLTEPIRLGHKMAVRPIASDEAVVKYGQTIGFATESIAAGQHVHTHNLTARPFERDYAPCSEIPPDPPPLEGRTFMGYRRAGGRVGTRNYVAIISNVNCSASVSKYVARRFDAAALRDFPNIDGVVAFAHHSGCGMQYAGTTHEMLNRVMGGIAKHPNIAAYLLIGLGCEQGTIGSLIDDARLVQIDGIGDNNNNDGRPLVLSMQDMGGTVKTVEEGVRLVAGLLPRANDVRRESTPASEIVLATECGGSDGNSGITANPAVGIASDMLVAAGGTTILAETPEIYGGEHLLTRRAVTPAVADKLIERIKWWEWYAGVFGAQLDNNPSAGNKEGGLTTIYEKSLGAIAKAGSTALREVYQYAEQVTAKGLVVMDTPGFDPPSVTGMVAGGANVVVFTTGRGSCYGCKPTPSIKIASNTPMYQRMTDDMDLNAGVVLEGTSVEQVGRQIFDEILEVASGKKTKSEQHGIGDEEFVPWIIGPVL
ncbi:MAG: altronate dehydratase [Planctomycetes bacterium]|nr:altronate dehydratase [Planctomycetota bacterium]